MCLVHFAFLVAVVLTAHHPVVFFGLFLFFIGYTTAYADYQHERAEQVGEDSELVLVNLYHAPLGTPMTYRAAKGFFDRLAGECGFAVRPHMLRDTAATDWEVRGIASDASFDGLRDCLLIWDGCFGSLLVA